MEKNSSEVLRPTLPVESISEDQATEAPPTAAAETKSQGMSKGKPSFPKQFMLDALEQSSDENGWAHLGTFGSYLNKLQPDFDSRNYGFKKLSDLVKAKTDLFGTEERSISGSNNKQLYIRSK